VVRSATGGAKLPHMSTLKIGLMGLGRVGRHLFRILHGREDVQITAISDVADPQGLAYLLRYDTLLGPFDDPISMHDGKLFVAGRRIPLITGADANAVRWADHGVDVVIEATGQSRSRKELEQHLAAGASRVILCSPPSEPLDLTVIGGINDETLNADHRLISCSSNTAHCAAPLLQILQRAFGIERAFLSSIHAYTAQQRLADVPVEDKRLGRAAAENIIPQETHVADIVCGMLPELKGRLTAKALNVPVSNGSLIDLVCWHESDVSVEDVNEVVRTAAGTEHWRRILGYTTDPIVSSDIVRSPYSGIFDSLATMVSAGRVSKTLTWYDNGWGYAHRVVDLIERHARLEKAVA
jgi:glyceraldehyde 3-phosphate dehydrogenase